MHIGPKRNPDRHSAQTASRFSQAVDRILKAKHGCKTVIVAGDCAAMHGSHDDYNHFAELIDPLRKAQSEFHFAIGNHDHRDNFLSAFRGVRDPGDARSHAFHKYAYVIEKPMANWFFLDSLEMTNSPPGSVGTEQLNWLAQSLDARPGKPALVVAHHDAKRGSDHALHDAEALYNVMTRRRHVKAYIFGHTHRWQVGNHHGIHLVNIPTIASWKDDRQPWGYLTAYVRSDGMSLMLHCTHRTDPHDGDTRDLTWRA
jgi:3',5'-cyclic-AMP phosphodiesterase